LLILLAVLGAALAHAYILGTESLDVVYQATQGSVNVVPENGGSLWSNPAHYPLIATNAYGGCLAVADRPYIYQVNLNTSLLYTYSRRYPAPRPRRRLPATPHT